MTWLPLANPRPVLLQFASGDRFVPQDVADAITHAAGPTATAQTHDASHHLDEAAWIDRDAWLAKTLGFPATE